MVYTTDETVATAIRSIDALVPKIIQLNKNETNFRFETNDSFLESNLVEMRNFSGESLIFPKNTKGTNNTMKEMIIIPTEQFKNESSIRVSVISKVHSSGMIIWVRVLTIPSIQVTTTVIPGDGRNTTGIISVVLLTKSTVNLTNSTNQSYSTANDTYVMKNVNVSITLIFPTIPPDDDTEYVCLALDNSTGTWSSEGIITRFNRTTNTTACDANHLTTFAVLIQTKDKEISIIEKIIGSAFSYIFLCISFLALVITIILYFVAGIKFIKVEMNILYLNYAIALLMAIGCFIIGIESVSSVKWLCTMMGLFLHYSWLSVFSWSLCNGILIFYRLFIGQLLFKCTIEPC